MKKINIAIVNGSLNSNSKTIKYVNDFIYMLDQKLINDEVKINMIEQRRYKINACIGCSNCFTNGVCPLDSSDDMKIVKNILCNADIIIFSTPVYLKMVTSTMKQFLDRISYWTHLFKLHNKIGIIAITSASSGVNETNSYLIEVLSHLGISVVGTLYNDLYASKKYTELEIDRLSSLVKYLLLNQEVLSNDLLEYYFTGFKYFYNGLVENNKQDAEIKYWKDNGFITKGSYIQLLYDYNGVKIKDG